MKRNMYVDEMMKSTNTTENAVGLASQLRKLLERGGFHLTKWYSNDRVARDDSRVGKSQVSG